MKELTFETILRLPQMDLKKTLKAELKSRGFPVTDKPGYLYAEGTIPVLLVAHMDTVHRQPVEQICYSADGAVAMSPQGIGGDDRCGVWMILQILRTTNCHVLFCENEEVGCVGAKKFTRGSLRPQVNYIVELDRCGSNDAVFYRCDNPEFENFVTSFGFETAGGSCSDMVVGALWYGSNMSRASRTLREHCTRAEFQKRLSCPCCNIKECVIIWATDQPERGHYESDSMAVKIDAGDDNPAADPCGVAGEVVCSISASLFCMVFLSAGQCAIGDGGAFVPPAAVAGNGSTSNADRWICDFYDTTGGRRRGGTSGTGGSNASAGMVHIK
jgi:hypothetical protein